MDRIRLERIEAYWNAFVPIFPRLDPGATCVFARITNLLNPYHDQLDLDSSRIYYIDISAIWNFLNLSIWKKRREEFIKIFFSIFTKRIILKIFHPSYFVVLIIKMNINTSLPVSKKKKKRKENICKVNP